MHCQSIYFAKNPLAFEDSHIHDLTLTNSTIFSSSEFSSLKITALRCIQSVHTAANQTDFHQRLALRLTRWSQPKMLNMLVRGGFWKVDLDFNLILQNRLLKWGLFSIYIIYLDTIFIRCETSIRPIFLMATRHVELSTHSSI